jgi:hypothetical protein
MGVCPLKRQQKTDGGDHPEGAAKLNHRLSSMGDALSQKRSWIN